MRKSMTMTMTMITAIKYNICPEESFYERVKENCQAGVKKRQTYRDFSLPKTEK